MLRSGQPGILRENPGRSKPDDALARGTDRARRPGFP